METVVTLPTGNQSCVLALAAPSQRAIKLRSAKHSCLAGPVGLGLVVTTHMALGSSGTCSGQGRGQDMDINMDINMGKLVVVVDGQQQMLKLFSVRTGPRKDLVLTETAVTLLMERDRSGA